MTTKTPSEKILPKRLKHARKKIGLSQMELGVRAGIDEMSASPRINQYERGVHFPDYGTARRLADALKVPVSFLFEADDALAELIFAYGEMKSSSRKQLLKLAEEFLRGKPD